AFMRTYKPMVHPMASQDLWAKTNFPPLLPPKYHKQPGRPKKRKVRSAAEPLPSSNPEVKHLQRYNLETKCSICNRVGHNKRKCPKTNEAKSSSH
ncbi:PREDICTED: LOC18777017 isoform, partial [Prunus dulcis]